jgi:hypothetical protein
MDKESKVTTPSAPEALSDREKLIGWLRENAPDCGDNSCVFGGQDKGGMRTNGGCRCFKDLPTMKRIYVERLYRALRSLPDGLVGEIDVVQLLTDPENQPHQFVGDPAGLRALLVAAEPLAARPPSGEQAVRDAEIGKRVRRMVDGGPLDLRDSPKSFIATCERLVQEADAALSDAGRKG